MTPWAIILLSGVLISAGIIIKKIRTPKKNSTKVTPIETTTDRTKTTPVDQDKKNGKQLAIFFTALSVLFVIIFHNKLSKNVFNNWAGIAICVSLFLFGISYAWLTFGIKPNTKPAIKIRSWGIPILIIFLILKLLFHNFLNSKGVKPNSNQISSSQESSIAQTGEIQPPESSACVPPSPIYQKELTISGEWQTLKTIPYKNYRYQFDSSKKIEWRYKGFPNTREELIVLGDYSAMNIGMGNPGNIPAQIRSVSGESIKFLLTVTHS